MLHHTDPHEWIRREKIKTTDDVELPARLMDEVIGQDEAVAVAEKAARQGRHLLMLGDPGTGKSMIARAMAEILPQRPLQDVLCDPNPADANLPVIRVVPGGQGRATFEADSRSTRRKQRLFAAFEWFMALGLIALGTVAFFLLNSGVTGLLLIVMCIIAAVFFLFVTRQMARRTGQRIPNLLIENAAETGKAPYVDATGSRAGGLLGDVRHDPYQSGGLETPTHLRVEPGAIHRADKGLLFIDEINVLRLESQQALLTAMQEKRYAITGQSQSSSGAMVRTQPVPCDFILVAAGNMDVIDPSQHSEHVGLHPALRSRIRGYGYEVYVRSLMDDNDENRRKLVRFVAQEVRRDGRVPPLDAAAIAEVIREAQRRSGHSGKLTLRLRELGGLVRTAGDVARDDGRDLATVEDVVRAKLLSQSLEHQVTRRGIEATTAKEAFQVEGTAAGLAAGAAFLGTGETGEPAGMVVPIESAVTSAADRQRGQVFFGRVLAGDQSVADNVAAILKAARGPQAAGFDLHVQALLRTPGVNVEPLGAAAAIAALSALEGAPVNRDVVIIGGVGVSGRLRGVDGVSQMIEAAADLGYKKAVVPAANKDDVQLEHGYGGRIEVVHAEHLADVVLVAFAGRAAARNALAKRLRSPLRPAIEASR